MSNASAFAQWLIIFLVVAGIIYYISDNLGTEKQLEKPKQIFHNSDPNMTNMTQKATITNHGTTVWMEKKK